MRRQFVISELSQHNGLLFGKHSCMQQLRQHSFNAVRVFCHIFQEQNTFVDSWQIRRANQAAQHTQIAAPQHCIFGQHGALWQMHQISDWQTPTSTLSPALHHVIKTILHDVIHRQSTEISARMRPGPGVRTGLGKQSHLQCSEVAVSDP